MILLTRLLQSSLCLINFLCENYEAEWKEGELFSTAIKTLASATRGIFFNRFFVRAGLFRCVYENGWEI